MADVASDLHLTVNGEHHAFADALTVYGLLERLGRDPGLPGVAVAVGDRVVRRSEWAATALRDGDRVEIVTAAQGG